MMKYFNYSEFDSPDVQGSGQMMDKDFLNLLDQARDRFDKPININSGFRTPAHNESVGGKENSSHLKGLAVDIHIGGSDDRFALYEALRKVGFKRLGVAKTFIHADIDPDKSPDVMWVY